MAGDLQGMGGVVGGEEHGARLAMGQVADELQHHLLVGQVQRRAGLIQQDILAGAHQRAGNQHQLLLAAGERTKRAVSEVGDAQLA
jgi:hypothetical protein